VIRHCRAGAPRHKLFRLRQKPNRLGAKDGERPSPRRGGRVSAPGGCRMKRLLSKILTDPRPLRVVLARRLIRWLRPPAYVDRLAAGDVERPQYAYCIYQAAKLASLLGYPRISVIEFGCGGGNGLIDAEAHIQEVARLFPVEIELYGFDTGVGLPAPRDYRDMPHYFEAGLYQMDRVGLEGKLTRAKLVIGDVRETCATFFRDYSPAPIGCMFHDLDYYSATRDALMLLDADPAHFLPRIFNYFDDILGDDVWLCNEFTGERLAIDEFNRDHASQKFSKCDYLPLAYPDMRWPHQIYAYHDFRHPKYNDFVAGKEQHFFAQVIELR
jgi:hypothetical protein